MPVSITTVHPVDPFIKEGKMPWAYPTNIPSVAKNWTTSEQKICTRVANAVLRRNKWSDASEEEKKKIEGDAIRACIRAAGKTKYPGGRKLVELDPYFCDDPE